MSTFTVPIVTIKTAEKHPDADSLDIITFNEIGWTCVDRIGIRKPDDKVVYIPIDSNVNVNIPQFDFLKSKAKSNGLCRIKTIKLRDQISQGLIIDLPAELNNLEIGSDVSEYFNISKYEPPQEQVVSMNAKGFFPSWCPQTDAERYQNYNRIIEEYFDEDWYVSIKLDGTSLTCFHDSERTDDEFGVCSRKQELYSPEHDMQTGQDDINKWGFSTNAYWEMARKYNLKEKLEEIRLKYDYEKIAIQGEICGPGIQKNKLNLKEKQFFAFDIFVVSKDYCGYLDPEEFLDICDDFGIPIVPQYGVLKLNGDFSWINSIYYNDVFDQWNIYPIEGAVFIKANQKHRIGKLGRPKFKVINPEFLLKQKGD